MWHGIGMRHESCGTRQEACGWPKPWRVGMYVAKACIFQRVSFDGICLISLLVSVAWHVSHESNAMSLMRFGLPKVSS